MNISKMRPRVAVMAIAVAAALSLGTAGVASAATAHPATAKAAKASPDYLVLEVAKVPGAFHVVTGTGLSLKIASANANKACHKYLAAAGALFAPQDCNSGVWVHYGYVAYAVAHPNSRTVVYSWGFGWGHTAAQAADNAEYYCRQTGGNACNGGAVARTPGYTGAQATSGYAWNDPLTNAVNWEIAHAHDLVYYKGKLLQLGQLLRAGSRDGLRD